MKIFNFLKKTDDLPVVSNESLVAVCKGEMITPSKIEDAAFSKEIMGKSVGFIPESNEIVSPCNGVLEVLFPTKHAFAVRMEDGTGILVHIGINTVDLNGAGFKSFAKQGDRVKAGQKILEVDFKAVEEAGCAKTTILIISEPVAGKNYVFKSFGPKEKSEIIL